MTSPDPLAEDDLRPLRDQVRDKLREWIIDGRLEPNSPIRERELAEVFGVSRVPVREAIRMLEVEGFVAMRPRRGAVVRSLTRRDVEELFDVREHLEALEATLAARRIGPEGVRRLRELNKEARESIDSGLRSRLPDLNARFHEEISTAADNRTLADVLKPLAGRLRWNATQNAHPERILREHEQLAQAIIARDASEAAASALRHAQSRRDVLLHDLPTD